MQVINGRNFIFLLVDGNFGALYKSTQHADIFLNTFTPCNFRETALQFYYIKCINMGIRWEKPASARG